MKIQIFVLVLKLLLLLLAVSVRVSSFDPIQIRLEQISKESYNRVAALVVSFFSERCKLGLQNCIFQTQWDHLFAKNKPYLYNNKKASSSSVNADLTPVNETLTYHVCKAFIIGKFCIDDYLLKSDDYAECLNETNGNRPQEFKRSLDQIKECRDDYSFYLTSSSSSFSVQVRPTNYISSVLFIFSFFSQLL